MHTKFGTRDGIRGGSVLPRRMPLACSADVFRDILKRFDGTSKNVAGTVLGSQGKVEYTSDYARKHL
jgi:hypothetical protein